MPGGMVSFFKKIRIIPCVLGRLVCENVGEKIQKNKPRIGIADGASGFNMFLKPLAYDEKTHLYFANLVFYLLLLKSICNMLSGTWVKSHQWEAVSYPVVFPSRMFRMLWYHTTN